MKTLKNFKEVSIANLDGIKGAGAYTTHNGTANGDYQDSNWLYVYADEAYYFTSNGGVSYQ